LTISAGKNGVLGYWGTFYDTTTQTVTSTTQAYIIGLNSSDPDNDGVVVTDGNKIVPTTPGVYNISFSVQVSNSDTQIHDASFWYRKNGTDLPYSASILSIPNKHGGVNGRIIFYVDIVLKLQPTDYIQLAWSATNTALSLETIPAGTIAPSPVSPSVIVLRGADLMRWVDATFRLPVAANMPVEVELAGGGTEKRDTVTGDWRPVIRWRTVVDNEPKSRKKKA